MAKNKVAPNDSLMQASASTREPSTRFEGSLMDSSLASSRPQQKKAANTGGVSGGSFTSYMMDHVARMHGDIESTTRKLEFEQRRLYRLDKDLASAETEHADHAQKRKKFKISQSAHEDLVQNKAHDVRRLEKQLEKAIADLNKGQSENELLREQIDKNRKDRLILDSVFQQLERSIGASKKVIGRLQSNIAAEKLLSIQAKQRCDALGNVLHKERTGFHKMTLDMAKAVDEEGKVQREQDQLSKAGASTKHEGGRKPYMVADEEEAFSESAMHRRILKLSFLNTIQRRHIKQHHKNIEVFEQAFATIKSTTGISDIEEIVKIFVALEQRNFSLLTYVNQLNREIEAVEIRNRELKSQLKNHKAEEGNSETRKDGALSEVQSQINKTRAATREKEALLAESDTALDECRPLVWSIVRFLKAELPKVLSPENQAAMKTPPPDEHENHLNNHLMYVEEALTLFRALLPDSGTMRLAPLPKSNNPSVGVKSNDLPSSSLNAGEADSDDEEGAWTERPFSRPELRKKAQESMQKRKRKPGATGTAKPIYEEREKQWQEAAQTEVSSPSHPRQSSISEAAGSRPSEAIPVPKSPAKRDSSKDSPTLGEEEGKGGRDEMWWRTQGKEKKK